MPKPTKPSSKPAPAKKPAGPAGPSAPWLSDVARRRILHGVIAAFALSATAGGLYGLRRHVSRDLAFAHEPPRVVLKHRPAWMSDFLADQIATSVRPPGMHSALDARVLKDTVSLLKANPWISTVHQVRRVYGRGPGDTIEIDCAFRAPVALVKWGVYYWLVDGAGVKLPEQYTADLVPKVVLTTDRRTNIRIVEGVKTPPPESGRAWGGDDLAAGLDMIKLLFEQPYANDVVKVDVANFGGRVDVREAQVVLVTKWDTQVRWGRPVNASDFFIEAPTARKLQYLRDVYAQYGRLDANHKWIDVRFDKVTHPSSPPATALPASASTADTRR